MVPVALWLSRRFAAATLLFAHLNLETVGLLIVSGLAMALLVIDDKRGMRPLVKLGAQVGLALLAVVGFGIEIKFFSLPGGHTVQLGLLVAPVSVFWLEIGR